MTTLRQAAKETVPMVRLGEERLEVTCSFCSGRGTDPFGIMSWISTCCVSGGRGVVQVPASCGRSAHCWGTGDDASSALACMTYRGRGWVPQVKS